jgi:Glutamine amidotransferase class-I
MTKKILLIDNYDSFTYNVSQALTSLREGIEVEVIRNDRISVQEVKERIQQHVYDAIVISPGPGCPTDAGITLDLIRELGASYEAVLGRVHQFWVFVWDTKPSVKFLVDRLFAHLSQFMASLHRSTIRVKGSLLGCPVPFKQLDITL